MRFVIRHSTRYRYSNPVRLGPQWLRLLARDDGSQRIIDYQLAIAPEPQGSSDHLDLEGNRVTQVWFDGLTDHFDIELTMEVESWRHNPYDFILEPSAILLPVEYEQNALLAAAYLERSDPADTVTAFARELDSAVSGDTLGFLNGLTGRLYTGFSREHRASGEPYSPAVTLERRRGACRDLAVLFIDCCRSRGIAARFVSGYQKGDLLEERRHLHAWPEVYLPGAGWRGFDPTHGIAIADTHVTVAASAYPRNTLPIIGRFIGREITSTLDYEVRIEVRE